MADTHSKRNTIAIMIGDTQSDYSEELLRGFYTCAREENVNIIFMMGPQMPPYCMDILTCGIEGDYNYQFDTIYDYAHFIQPNALIITYGSLSTFHNTQDKQKFLDAYADIPYLLLEDKPDSNDAPYLIADNYNGMYTCIEHLIRDHGYTKIAFLSGPKNNRDACERLNAYLAVMRKYQITITDTMIAYGDYTEQVSEQVEYLLDNNPDLEAIACSNDSMAKACYSVCGARDLIVGSDIAVTGFDDVEPARTMEPPLTSISHNIFNFSYTALKHAIALCNGQRPDSRRMPVTFRRRCSCGCGMIHPSGQQENHAKDIDTMLAQCILDISDDLLSDIPYKKDRDRLGKLISSFFNYIYMTVFKGHRSSFHMSYLLGILKQFTSYPHVSSGLVLEHFANLLRLMTLKSENDDARKILTSILTTTQQYIHTADVLKLEQEIMDSTRKAWFVPSFTRDLTTLTSDSDLNHTMTHIMKRLQMMKVNSAYFYLFETPVFHEIHSPVSYPNQMFLTAYFTETEMIYYDAPHRPRVTSDCGCSTLISQSHPACLTSFILFSGEKQYGLMLCEVEQSDISFLQICSMQLGSLLHLQALNLLEQEYQLELKNSLKVIQEQNHILSFISEYDEMSRLLNRRGFMERALQACRQNVGKQAYLIFCDLDHLKEINDSFGHAAGDFAIRAAADRLRDTLPDNAITARIGGDEFISLILSSQTDFSQQIIRALKNAGNTFNASSGKPFYVELSIGIFGFSCNPHVDLNDIIQQSDKLLYEAKLNRRSSIKKSL